MTTITNADLATLSSDVLAAALNDRLQAEARQEANLKLARILGGAAPVASAAAPAAAVAAPAPAPKPAKAKKGGTGPSKEKSNHGLTKSEFIRAFDEQNLAEDGSLLPVKDVIESAASDGLELSYAMVFNTRKIDAAKAEAALAAEAAAKEAKKADKAKKAEKAAEPAAEAPKGKVAKPKGKKAPKKAE